MNFGLRLSPGETVYVQELVAPPEEASAHDPLALTAEHPPPAQGATSAAPSASMGQQDWPSAQWLPPPPGLVGPNPWGGGGLLWWSFTLRYWL